MLDAQEKLRAREKIREKGEVSCDVVFISGACASDHDIRRG